MLNANLLPLFRGSDRSVDMRVYVCKPLLHLATEVVHRLLDSFNELVRILELGRDGLEDIIQLERTLPLRIRKVWSLCAVITQDAVQGWQNSVDDRP